MGVVSDDGFKLTATDKAPVNNRAVRIHAPSTAAGSYYAVNGDTAHGGVFKVVDHADHGQTRARGPAGSLFGHA